MSIHYYTTGYLRKTLPPGALSPQYHLAADSCQVLHVTDYCYGIEGPTCWRDVPPEEITQKNSCECLMRSPGMPADFRALMRHTRSQHILTNTAEGLDTTDSEILHYAWYRLYLELRNAYLCSPEGNVEEPGATSVLNDLVTREHEMACAREESFRQRLQDHPDCHAVEQLHIGRARLAPGTYLMKATQSLDEMFRDHHQSLALLQIKGIDPYAPTITHAAGEKELSLFLDTLSSQQGTNTVQYALLEESDTPAIQEIACSLSENDEIPLDVALEIARTL